MIALHWISVFWKHNRVAFLTMVMLYLFKKRTHIYALGIFVKTVTGMAQSVESVTFDSTGSVIAHMGDCT